MEIMSKAMELSQDFTHKGLTLACRPVFQKKSLQKSPFNSVNASVIKSQLTFESCHVRLWLHPWALSLQDILSTQLGEVLRLTPDR